MSFIPHGILSLLAVAGICLPITGSAQSAPLVHGHSHNDYLQDKPLFDALESGFTSIEVDVHSFRGEIRVSHLGKRLKRKPGIETLYLRPLAEWIDKNGGQVFQGDAVQLTLMIDLKSDKDELIPMLSRSLVPYHTYIDRDGDPDAVSAPVRILLSGGPDIDLVAADTTGVFAVDAGLQYIESGRREGLVERISSNYRSHFRWKGNGHMPIEERQLLEALVAAAHAADKKIRFWKSPDKPAVWTVLLDAGVDWINVDDLQGFREYMDRRARGH